ncbi:MAG TPA: LamG-like jellyroll fold domain-containing protein, partial [Propionibacteriaceae bacterium]|nr:LamG-like jellyroll fold domain-containing protein [Propionibacteriaceae bacterium]
MTTKPWKISAAASIVLLAGVLGALFGAGYHYYVVQTPSMGTTAPVGTLVAVHAKNTYTIGDVVSYERNGRVYTHRIVAETAAGFTTQGDINGTPDALPVTRTEIVGAVTFYGKGLGFLAEALPWLVIGGALVYVLSMRPWVGRTHRWPFRLVGWSLVASFTALWLHPWVNMVMTGYVAEADGVRMHLVNTGILPLKVMGIVLASGQDAVVTQTVADGVGHYSVTPHLALNSWYFVLLLVICLIPLVAALFIGGDRVPLPVEAAVASRPLAVRVRRAGPVALTVSASILAAVLVLQMSTNAAFAASISNSTDTVAVRTWVTCQNAETSTPNAWLVWGLTAVGSQADLTGNGNTGTMRSVNGSTPAAVSASSPCPYDTQGSLMFNGATCVFTPGTVAGSETYSEEIWFRSAAASLNGKLMGFSDNSTPTTGNQKYFDRHIYLDPTGRVVFGVVAGGAQAVISSLASYTNGAWHHVVATSAPGRVALYVDGALAATRSSLGTQSLYKGDWMVGCGLLTGWPDASGNSAAFPAYYTGNLRLA